MTSLGGLGLFLLGMHLMTGGLRQLAGNRLRTYIRTTTRTPLSGAVSGAMATALLQSSSATTVATVGFVSAGLMTFPQALGVIFGANIGTTITGRMVALLGFKLKIGLIALPLVFVGVLAILLGRGIWKPAGLALAGFGLLFVGIDTLTDGLSVLKGAVTPDSFPSNTLLGRLQLVGLGVVITVITQSSSAGVATALAALSVGAISFPQAAALVIGMDVGTTATAAMATIGGSVASRRTGFAHVIYNILTGFMAFWLLIPLGWLVQSAGTGFDPQLALVGFHTAFNLLGVIAALGASDKFGHLVMFLVPSDEQEPADRLDEKLLSDAGAALDAAEAAVRDQAGLMNRSLSDQFGPPARPINTRALNSYDQTIERTREFVDAIRLASPNPDFRTSHVRLLHALDHMERLTGRLRQSRRIGTILETPYLAGLARPLAETTARFDPKAVPESLVRDFDILRKSLREERRRYREKILYAVSQDQLDLEDALAKLDGVRWLHRSAYHLWRMAFHLQTDLPHASDLAGASDREARLDIDMDDDLDNGSQTFPLADR